MTEAIPTNPIVRCPRCGYDQRGVIETWKDSCPLNGICSECGLEIEWAELLSDKIKRPAWNVECVNRSRSVPWRSVTTLARSLWPWGFWRSLQMHHETRWRRIAAYFVCLSLGLYLLFAGMQAAITVRFWTSVRPPNAINPAVAIAATPNVSVSGVALHSFAMPFSRTSPGTIRWGGLNIEYPPPIALLPTGNRFSTIAGNTDVWTWQGTYWMQRSLTLAPTPTLVQHRNPIVRYFDNRWALLRHGIVMFAFSAIAFVLLPQSRKKAKVRWAHVHRISAYAAAWLFVGTWMLITIDQIGVLTFSRLSTSRGDWFLAWFVIWPMWLICWCAASTKHYLKMPHAWGIAIAVVSLGFLVSLLTGSLSVLAWVVP